MDAQQREYQQYQYIQKAEAAMECYLLQARTGMRFTITPIDLSEALVWATLAAAVR